MAIITTPMTITAIVLQHIILLKLWSVIFSSKRTKEKIQFFFPLFSFKLIQVSCVWQWEVVLLHVLGAQVGGINIYSLVDRRRIISEHNLMSSPKTKDPKGTTNEAGKFKTKMSYSLIWFKNIVVCLPRSVKMSWRSSSILILNMYPYVCLTPRLRKKVCYKCEKNAETSWIGKWTSSIKLKCDSLYVISSFPMFYTMFCGFKKRNETMWLIHKKSSKGNNLEI